MKQCIAALLALLLLVGMPVSAAEAQTAQDVQPFTFAQPDFDVPCRAAVLMDQATGAILYEKLPDERLPIASITKVMTLLLTFEALETGRISLDDIVPVSEHAYDMGGSQIWLEPGEQMTLREMLKAICVASANDAAVAVAEYVGGSEAAFVEMMNAKAQELGLTGTHFANACGLDASGHLSCARDVAMLSRETLTKHPQITEYTTIWTDSLRGGETQLVNTNKLLRRYEGITGLKTGTTSGAGICITASATRNGLSLIAVVLGAGSSADRFDAATTLLDYGFANFENAAAPLPENAPLTLPVTLGDDARVTLAYRLPGALLVPKGGAASLHAELTLPGQLEAPVEQGAQVGVVQLYAGEQLLGEYPVVTAGPVARRTLSTAFSALLRELCRL